VMERECKKLEVGRDLNKALVYLSGRLEHFQFCGMYCVRTQAGTALHT
jgi:hypothetical protein